jgi:chromosome partitioning protein
MIIVFGGVKGGQGKSTLACNAAIYRSNQSRDVLLVDGDKQGTTTDFTIMRKETLGGHTGYTAIQLKGTALRDEVKQLSTKYDDVIIDVGGRDTTEQRSALCVANVYAVPFLPSSFDLWTLQQVDELVSDVKAINQDLIAYCFLNKADSRGKENLASAEIAQEENLNLSYIDAPIILRKIFRDAGSVGLGIIEHKPRNSKAEAELLHLFKYLFDPKLDIKKKSKRGR